MTKKKSISPSSKEKDRKSDCQSIEEPKRWCFNWRKMILLEPTSELIILVILALLYGGFYYYKHYTVNESNIYGLWQSENHTLAISYEYIRRHGDTNWQVVQDGKTIINVADTRTIKKMNDGTLHIDVYAPENILSKLPQKGGYNYLEMYVRKGNLLTYDGESYKRINSGNKTITWKDGSTSPYGERKTFFDYSDSFLFWGMVGTAFLSIIVIGWRNIKSKKVRKKSL